MNSAAGGEPGSHAGADVLGLHLLSEEGLRCAFLEKKTHLLLCCCSSLSAALIPLPWNV